MSLWKWNNVELEIDLDDADFIERYENAFNKVGETEKELQKVGLYSGIIRDYCKMFYQLFDDIFEPGTGDKLFGGKHNARLCEQAYDSFLNHVKKERDASNKRRFETVKKYKVKK